jgi:uncharacterized protein YvpB
MPTINQAVAFAIDNEVIVGEDIQLFNGCEKTDKYFYVYANGKEITVTQTKQGARTWEHSGNTYYNRAAAIIHAVTMISGAEYEAQ